MIPRGILVFGVVFATIAAVIASQALISGSYTLVSEAIKLKLLPRLKIIYPEQYRSNVYSSGKFVASLFSNRAGF